MVLIREGYWGIVSGRTPRPDPTDDLSRQFLSNSINDLLQEVLNSSSRPAPISPEVPSL